MFLDAFNLGDSYVALVPFEADTSSKCKLIKRAVDILQGFLGKLNVIVHKSSCRAVWYQLGKWYTDLAEHKSQLLGDQPDRIKKMKDIFKKAIANYMLIITQSDEQDELFILAHFLCGSLHFKLGDSEQDYAEKQMNDLNGVRLLEEMQKLMHNASDCIRSNLQEQNDQCKQMLMMFSIKSLYSTLIQQKQVEGKNASVN